MGWKAYLTQRETDEKRRKRERMNAENKAKTLTDQANKMRAKATKAQAAQSMLKRAEKLMAGIEGERARRQGRPDQVPRARAVRQDAAHRRASCRSPTARSRSSPTSTSPSTRASRVVILGLNGAGKTTLLRILAGVDQPDTGEVVPGPRAQDRLLRPGARDPRHQPHRAGEHAAAPRPQLTDTEARSVLGSFLFSGDDAHKPAGVLSGGEKTRLALAILVVSSANVLLLDEPTNNLDPASREEVLAAIRTYEGAIVLVTHDEGAVHALEPDRVLLLPDGVEDLWNDDYADLVSLA